MKKKALILLIDLYRQDAYIQERENYDSNIVKYLLSKKLIIDKKITNCGVLFGLTEKGTKLYESIDI